MPPVLPASTQLAGSERLLLPTPPKTVAVVSQMRRGIAS